MSRSPRPKQAMLAARNFGLGVLTFVGMRTIYFQIVDVIAVDPFARMRDEANTGIAEGVGIRLDKVRIRSYNRGKPVSSAMVDRVDVSKDRQIFTLTGIHDGVFKQDGENYRYEANAGIWRANSRQLIISGSARLQNANFDLRTASLQFDDHGHTITAEQPVTGPFYKGTLAANRFTMNTETHEFKTGPVDYRGKLAMAQVGDGGDQTEQKLWHFSGDGVKSVRATGTSPAAQYYTQGRAEDDETIMKADLIVRYPDTDVVKAYGKAKYYSAKADITADQAILYQKEKRVVLQGHVTIYVKPKSDEKKPPVEEPTPEFKRSTPDQLAGMTLSADGRFASKTLGASGAGQAGLKPPTLGSPSTTKAVPQSPPVGSSAVRSAVTPDATTTPTGSTATTSTTQTPTPSPTTPTVKSQNPPPVKKNPATQTGKVPPKDKSAQTPDEKKLDDELRSGKTIRKYPMVIVCDQVEYTYRKGQRHGHVIGSPQGRQDMPGGRWRYVWSTTADYDAEKDKLSLASTPTKIDVRMMNSKGDDLKALDLTVSTKEDAAEDDYKGHKVTAVGTVDTNADTADDKTKSTTTKPKPPIKG